jgi:hypothetical protein
LVAIDINADKLNQNRYGEKMKRLKITKLFFFMLLLTVVFCQPAHVFAIDIDPTLDKQSFLNLIQASPNATIVNQTPTMIPMRQAGGEALATFSESFDDITTLAGDGWATSNQSETQGITDWFQGNDVVFPGQAGGYIAANFNNTVSGYISNWLLSPEINLSKGTISFWSRATGQSWPDRLQIRMSTNGSSTDTGTTYSDVGVFTILLGEINSTESQYTYPEIWTQYTYDLPDVSPGTTGRIAFRYYVSNGGPLSSNSNYIGIDEASYSTSDISSIPTVNEWGMLIMSFLIAGTAIAVFRRRKKTGTEI